MHAQMNLLKAIRELYEERKRLDRVIASLEELQKNPAPEVPGQTPADRRRGRKEMSAEERRVVSARMKKYWEARRKA